MEGIGDFQIDVAFCTLPDACFFYSLRGHLVRDCDKLKKLEQEELEKEDGTFCEVKKRRGSQSPPTQSNASAARDNK